MPRGIKQDTANEGGNGKPKNKMDAVRRTMSKLGKKVKPLKIQAYVKDEWNIDMNTTVISSYKNTIKNERKPKNGRRKKQKGRPAAMLTGRLTEITLADIQAVKDLADRMGAEKLRELAEVFAK